jgi:hypothetical protein|tara:strand:- start:1010 stop:1246 length:237 start_codon:yes stop_codon:yes gene_type:complete
MIKAKLLENGRVILEKGGHTDAASAINSCKTIMSHCQMILNTIDENKDGLPTWWTNKLAVSEHEVVQAANSLVNGLEE